MCPACTISNENNTSETCSSRALPVQQAAWKHRQYGYLRETRYANPASLYMTCTCKVHLRASCAHIKSAFQQKEGQNNVQSDGRRHVLLEGKNQRC